MSQERFTDASGRSIVIDTGYSHDIVELTISDAGGDEAVLFDEEAIVQGPQDPGASPWLVHAHPDVFEGETDHSLGWVFDARE
jgi:hypothetical protein